jgi:hypothetical protein
VHSIAGIGAYATLFDPFPLNSTQSSWFERGTKVAFLEQGKSRVSFAKELFAAHARVCLYDEESQQSTLDSSPSPNACPLRAQAQPPPSPKLTFPSLSTSSLNSASPPPSDAGAAGGVDEPLTSGEAPSPAADVGTPIVPGTGTPTKPRPSLSTLNASNRGLPPYCAT